MDHDYYTNAMQVIAVAEAFGYLNPPRLETSFLIHPFNVVRESNSQFFHFMEKFLWYPRK